MTDKDDGARDTYSHKPWEDAPPDLKKKCLVCYIRELETMKKDYDSLKAVAERMNKALNNDCYCEISPKECDYCIEKREIRAAYRQYAEGRGRRIYE